MKSALAIAGATKRGVGDREVAGAGESVADAAGDGDGSHGGAAAVSSRTIDVWAEAQELATSVGARLYHDRTGRCVLLPAGPSRHAVAAYARG
jgi:hypothetical protein